MTKCKDCETPINDDDRRWNKNPDTVYCRECVHEPVMQAKTWLNRMEERVADAQRIYDEEKGIAKEKMRERPFFPERDELILRAMDVATQGDGNPRDLSWMKVREVATKPKENDQGLKWRELKVDEVDHLEEMWGDDDD